MRTHLVRLTAEGEAALARWRAEQEQGWREAWRAYANCGGNDFDRGWNCQQSDTETAPTHVEKVPASA